MAPVRWFLFQGRYNITNRWTLNGHYTLQLNNDGNYEGEGANTPGATGRIGDYPEIFTAAQHFPEGECERLPAPQDAPVDDLQHGHGRLGRPGDVSALAY